MWKRVHVAVIQGPDIGHVIDLGACGSTVPQGPWVVIGRGVSADYQILDSSFSRYHCRFRAGINRLGQAGVWVDCLGSTHHVGIGRRWRSGSTLFEVRTDGPPPRSGPRLTLTMPLVAGLGFAMMWLMPGLGPWPILFSIMITPLVVLLSQKKRKQPLPDPASLRRQPFLDAGQEHHWVVDIGDGGRFGRRRKLTLMPQEIIGFAGDGADGMARWVAAQLGAYGGHITELTGLEQRGFEVTFDHHKPVLIMWSDHPSTLPTNVTRACPTRVGHHRNVSQSWFDTFLDHTAGATLPDAVPLDQFLPILNSLFHQWNTHDAGLSAVVAIRAGATGVEPLEIDLAADAPHALVAGTTGAGKSELLTTWLLSLASQYPPSHMSFILVDYKGGATFTSLQKLPHVLGVLTDLDHGHTIRALDSLSAEIHRRERLFHQVQASSLVEYNDQSAHPLARLVIVVDEFRVLADEYPEVLDQLVRVAAQGRSLGIHVILATQRPGGVMTPDIRANMGVRLCLRVVEETDSLDLLGTIEAAHLPPVPGRMIVSTTNQDTAQTLWAGDALQEILKAANKTVAQHPHFTTTSPPWAPPLPSMLTRVPTHKPHHVCLGIADLPDQQRLAPWNIPIDATLIIAGEPGAGLTNALNVAAQSLLNEGRSFHFIGHHPLLPSTFGSFAPVYDPPTCLALLDRLNHTGGEDALLIDDLPSLVEGLEAVVNPGESVSLLQHTLRRCRHQRRFTVIATHLPLPSWLSGSHRLVFLPADPHLGLIAGINKEFNHPAPPGRAVMMHRGDQRLIQVPFVDEIALPTHPPTPEFSLTPLPETVTLSALNSQAIAIGTGGENHHRVDLPCTPGEITLIIGPPGSGKTHLIQVITARAILTQREQEITAIDDAHTLSNNVLDKAWALAQQGRHTVVSTTPEGLSATFHPLIQHAKNARHQIYIGQMPRSSVGFYVNRYISPAIIGRGVLVHQGRFLPVQIDSGQEVLANQCTEDSSRSPKA